MDALLWTCVLGLLSTPAVATRAESLVVSQSPKAISLVKVNSTAEIQCRTNLLNPIGLYLKRRFSKEMDVLYLSLAAHKINVNPEYKHRLSVKGQCCDYTLHLSQLGLKDTDGYYCRWSTLNSESGSLMTYESTDTIIIIRERDPYEDCNRSPILHQILFLLSVTASVVAFCVFVGVLAWWCTRTKESYRPARMYHQHHSLCPQHSNQQHIYPIN
ncbi:hypothetical protein AAFF_G00408480 [Aldrovandia affinis]|uniref:Immunoglobulin V-set domain-containing protein n=1 Tax=Aldrovandia affinis TaxID=143900 RepID=A0AAD7SCE6_9TELE|nr:hypothetical protein AAFF_G00408480 [Aldrovandia affinis]